MRFVYNKPIRESDGMYSYVFQEENNDKIYFDTPYLILSKKPYLSKDKLYLEAIIPSNEKDFFRKIINYEEDMINIIHKNSRLWFGKTMPIEILDDFHLPLTKINNEGIPKIKLQLNNDFIDNDTLEVGDKIMFNLHYVGIKFLRQNFCLSCKIENYRREDEEILFDNNVHDNIMESFINNAEDYNNDFNEQIKILDDIKKSNKHKSDKNTQETNTLENIKEINIPENNEKTNESKNIEETNELENIEIEGDEEIIEEIINNNSDENNKKKIRVKKNPKKKTSKKNKKIILTY